MKGFTWHLFNPGKLSGGRSVETLPAADYYQMALSNQYFDSYFGEGTPVFVQKVQNFLLVPLARLMGYQSYYEKYDIEFNR